MSRRMKNAAVATLAVPAAAVVLMATAGSASAATTTSAAAGGYVNTFVVKYWAALGDPWGICQSDANRSNAEEGLNPDGSKKYYCADAGEGDVNMWKRHLA
ncbi:hypothetical protein [Streptomyces sp. NPDC060184]|uniref:hypothetical protein n=1 Tax=Streptomyces sp. NPDC060184 TaxID=3347064 RepID=UPI00365FB664